MCCVFLVTHFLSYVGDPLIQLMFAALCRAVYIPCRLVSCVDLPPPQGLPALKAAQFLNLLPKSSPAEPQFTSSGELEATVQFSPKSSVSTVTAYLRKNGLTQNLMLQLATPLAEDCAESDRVRLPFPYKHQNWSMRTEDSHEMQRRLARLASREAEGLFWSCALVPPSYSNSQRILIVCLSATATH